MWYWLERRASLGVSGSSLESSVSSLGGMAIHKVLFSMFLPAEAMELCSDPCSTCTNWRWQPTLDCRNMAKKVLFHAQLLLRLFWRTLK